MLRFHHHIDQVDPPPPFKATPALRKVDIEIADAALQRHIAEVWRCAAAEIARRFMEGPEAQALIRVVTNTKV
jgi:hypothetical protein